MFVFPTDESPTRITTKWKKEDCRATYSWQCNPALNRPSEISNLLSKFCAAKITQRCGGCYPFESLWIARLMSRDKFTEGSFTSKGVAIWGCIPMEASKVINYEQVEPVNVSLTVAMVNNFVLNTSSFLNKYATCNVFDLTWIDSRSSVNKSWVKSTNTFNILRSL